MLLLKTYPRPEGGQQGLVAKAEAFLPWHEPIFVGQQCSTGVNWVHHSNVGGITFSGTDSWWRCEGVNWQLEGGG